MPGWARLLAPVAGAIVPILAVVAALAVGAIMLAAFGANPLDGYRAMFSGGFGGKDEIADTLVKATPLMLVGVGICIAFRAGVINIGGEGQIIAGAILSTTVALCIPVRPASAGADRPAGRCARRRDLGCDPGALKAYAGVNEILSTIMMNIIAGHFSELPAPGLAHRRGPDQDPADRSVSPRTPTSRSCPAAHACTSGSSSPSWSPSSATSCCSAARSACGFGRSGTTRTPRATRACRSRRVSSRPSPSAAPARASPGACWSSAAHHIASSVKAAPPRSPSRRIQRHRHRVVRWPPSALDRAGVLPVRRDAHRRHRLQREVQVPSALIIALNGVVVVFVVGSFRLKRMIEQWTDQTQRERA